MTYAEIKGGVRKGCILSPDLFSLYNEMIMREVKDMDGIKVNGENISNLRYADQWCNAWWLRLEQLLRAPKLYGPLMICSKVLI